MGFEVIYGLVSIISIYKKRPETKGLLFLITLIGSTMILDGVLLLSKGLGVWAAFGIQMGSLIVFTIIGGYVQKKLKFDKDEEYKRISTGNVSVINNLE